MSFISYAQNREDVLLWRALQHVENGFYVDVGANHPSDDSVTKAFYDRGWSGINVEPLAEHIEQLRAERPRDINLQAAVGAQEREIDFFNTSVRGLATASPAVAEMHHSAGLEITRSVVPLMRLQDIWALHVPGDVHFLKIDVEGYERQALEGMDFERFRPWIAVVEATVPNSRVIDASWEPLILNKGYRCVYFDGLNRYYLARERESLVAAFSSPPNVFDDFIPAETHRVTLLLNTANAETARAEQVTQEAKAQARDAEAQAQEAKAQARDAEAQAQEAKAQAQDAEAQAQEAKAQARDAEAQTQEAKAQARDAEAQAQEAKAQARDAEAQTQEAKAQTRVAEAQAQEAAILAASLQSALDAVHDSTSWRITQPMRQLVSATRQLRQGGSAAIGRMRDKAVAAALKVGRKAAAYLDAHPGARRLGGALSRRLGLHGQLLNLHHALRARPAPPRAIIGATDDNTGAGRFNTAVLPDMPLPPEAFFLEDGESVPSAEFWFHFLGHVEGHYSLAIVNRGLALALADASCEKLIFQPYHGQPYDKPADLPKAQRAGLEAAFSRRIPADEAGRTVSIVHHFPLISDPVKSHLRLILFFWEETAVPADTIAHINGHFDAVLAATAFVKRALRNSGCRLPIFVIPIGIDHLIDRNIAPITSLRPEPGAPFRFLHVSSVFDRKGPDVLLQAFFEQFTAADPVELLVKTFPNPHNRIREQLVALCQGRTDAPTVIIDESPLDEQGMLDLYRSAQALVLPTRGEGFNLPAAEALALGLPVIVTGHGAHLDFCTRATSLLTPFRFAKSRSHVRSVGANWVEPDAHELGRQMRQLQAEVLSGDRDLEHRRDAGIRLVRQIYTWQHGAEAVQAAVRWLDARLQSPPVSKKRRLALISPWNTRCGIAEYSYNLLCAFTSHALQIYCDTRTAPPPAESIYRPTWNIGETASVCSTLDLIAQDLPEVLLIQHQPSLFGLTDEFCAHLASIRRQGCVVLLELHSTLPLLAECRVSARSVTALRSLDRIIVHQPEDMNYLLELGLVDNVLLLAHGVIQPRPTILPSGVRSTWGIGQDDLVLACFGFILPHKGIDTLVDSLRPLAQATGRKVRLIGLNSILDARSEDTLRQYRNRAAVQGVENDITWITDFRPIDECVQILGMADYIVFPYKETRESASGAVTIGLATLKPVLVSPLPIFSDLSECTWRMTGSGVQDIVDTVCALEKNPGQAGQLLERQKEWLAECNWARVSERLNSVIEGLLIDRTLEATVSDRRDNFVAAHRQVREAQLLVDVSELYFRDARTGIQRVVRSILGELLANPPEGFLVRPIYGTANQGYRYTGRFGGVTDNEEEPVRVRSGDLFLGLDLSAHLFPQAEAQLHDLRLAGVRVHFVVYDIIPLLYPQFSVGGMKQAFETWLHSLAREADSLLCISAAVADDVRRWLDENTPAHPKPEVRHFHLGADIKNSAPSTGLPANASAILEQLRGHPTFLMVGTVEPRKGQAQALAAFEKLWNQGLDVHLVMVGKEGWMMEDFARQLHAHPEQGHRLLWLEGISDEFLEQIYSSSDCLIAASEAEGFGLPLIEAAQHKLPIIARDIPVFREVAGEQAFYYSGDEPDSLATAVQEWLSLHRAGKAPQSSSMPWLTWQQCTRNLLDIVLEQRARA